MTQVSARKTVLLVTFVLITHQAAAAGAPEAITTADAATPSYYRDGIAWQVLVEQWEGSEKRAVQHLQLRAQGGNTLAEFVAPPTVVGRKLLMKQRSMWFVKPGLFKPVPISPRQRLLGAAGYADVLSIGYADNFNVVKASEVVLDGKPCGLFELVAKSKDEVYPRVKYWVSKSERLGVRSEYYTDRGVLLKWTSSDYDNTLQVGSLKQRFVSRVVIHDATSKDSVAVLRFAQARVEAIPSSTFELNLLSQ